MPAEPRPEVAQLRPVVHGAVGGAELAAHGLDPAGVIDFSVNTNPLGPPPAALAAVANLSRNAIWRYPDPTALPLRRALAGRLDLDPDQIVVGNGSSELIWLLALAHVRPAPDSVLIVGPTFGEYERACRLLGATVIYDLVMAERDFHLDVAALASRIGRERPRVVWLCNPNNPTSRYLLRREIETVLDACVASGALLVVDEAYLAFVERPESLLPLLASGHLFLLRSLTKDYALAGLRLGYGVGTRQTADLLRAVQPPWSVSAAAQAAGEAAIADAAHLARAQAEVAAARTYLLTSLTALGLHVVPPTTNLVLVEVGDGATLRRQLLPHGIVVRDCASFGLPTYIRIGIRARAECARLVAALEQVLKPPTTAEAAQSLAGAVP
jgi:L-threonine-O-3-phosphate decarboxylase